MQPLVAAPWCADGPVPYRIRGGDIQTVELLLAPGERVVCEPDTFLCAAGGVTGLDVNFGRRARDILTRRWAGENTILQEIVAQDGPARVVLGSPRLGRIVRLPVREGRSVICQRGAFLAATGSVDITVALVRRLRAGFFGGQGAVFQRLTGDGDVFLHAVGSVVDWVLPAGTLARVSTRNVLAFEDSVGYDVQISGGALSLMFGSQQAFLSQLEGPGRILIQSMDVEAPAAQAPHEGLWRRFRKSHRAADGPGPVPPASP